MARRFGNLVKWTLVTVGLVAGLWLLHTAGPGWKNYRPPSQKVAGQHFSRQKTTTLRLQMLAAGAFFTGGSIYCGIAMSQRGSR